MRRVMAAERTRVEREMRAQMAAQMASEQEKRDEERQCAICLDADKNCAFNCGHQSCLGCAETLSVCHICRAPITNRVRVYHN